jgi:hypothetical protein
MLTENINLRMLYINTEILITEMGVSNQAKNVIPLKFLRKIKNTFFSSCELNPGTYCMYIFLIVIVFCPTWKLCILYCT